MLYPVYTLTVYMYTYYRIRERKSEREVLRVAGNAAAAASSCTCSICTCSGAVYMKQCINILYRAKARAGVTQREFKEAYNLINR